MDLSEAIINEFAKKLLDVVGFKQSLSGVMLPIPVSLFRMLDSSQMKISTKKENIQELLLINKNYQYYLECALSLLIGLTNCSNCSKFQCNSKRESLTLISYLNLVGKLAVISKSGANEAKINTYKEKLKKCSLRFIMNHEPIKDRLDNPKNWFSLDNYYWSWKKSNEAVRSENWEEILSNDNHSKISLFDNSVQKNPNIMINIDPSGFSNNQDFDSVDWKYNNSAWCWKNRFSESEIGLWSIHRVILENRIFYESHIFFKGLKDTGWQNTKTSNSDIKISDEDEKKNSYPAYDFFRLSNNFIFENYEFWYINWVKIRHCLVTINLQGIIDVHEEGKIVKTFSFIESSGCTVIEKQENWVDTNANIKNNTINLFGQASPGRQVFVRNNTLFFKSSSTTISYLKLIFFESEQLRMENDCRFQWSWKRFILGKENLEIVKLLDVKHTNGWIEEFIVNESCTKIIVLNAYGRISVYEIKVNNNIDPYYSKGVALWRLNLCKKIDKHIFTKKWSYTAFGRYKQYLLVGSTNLEESNIYKSSAMLSLVYYRNKTLKLLDTLIIPFSKRILFLTFHSIKIFRPDVFKQSREKKFKDSEKPDPFKCSHFFALWTLNSKYILIAEFRNNRIFNFQQKKVWNDVILGTLCYQYKIQDSCSESCGIDFIDEYEPEFFNSRVKVLSSSYNNYKKGIQELILKF